ncbi:MAG: ATP-binding cassette domain-containing protein [Planctomycetes bacterium]|nr:ATP-binding cassette domain-containing protein [Planctomycetota bacterium]
MDSDFIDPIARPGAVEVRGLTIRYGRTEVLGRTSFDLRPGELTTLEGPSGVGKSSLLDALAGQSRAARGGVWIRDHGGRMVSDPADRHLLASRVFQTGNLIGTLSVRDNVALRVTLGDLRDRLVDADALAVVIEHVLAELGLAGLGERRPGQLSGGQVQRVAIARGLVEPAPLLLVDEPTANLDRANAMCVIDALQCAAHEFGRTVVVASHDVELLGVADRRLAIHGRTLRDVTRAAAEELLA